MSEVLRDCLKETILNIGGVIEELEKVKRRATEHLAEIDASPPHPDALKLAEEIIDKIAKTFNDDLDPFYEGAQCAFEEALAAIRATQEKS